MRLSVVTVLGAVLVAGAVILLCRACPLRTQRPASPMPLVEAAPPEGSVPERRVRVKAQLARRVIAERMPLLEAAALFDAVNGEDGAHAARHVPGRSAREKCCRQVILYVTTAEGEIAREDGSLPEPRTSAVLQAEFDRRLAAGEFPPDGR